ncbi:MAG TPA: carboxylating nicotinate-nucleotide diphosphorylase [Pseudomonadales bacterium]|nr:carboxylating nicotinate-nucleotide diphosphorylase [Pseudomonadales bacterium]
MHRIQHLQTDIIQQVRAALAEDIGSGDITAQLIPAGQMGQARVITREPAVICGTPWVDEVMKQVDSRILIEWLVTEGEQVSGDRTLFTLHGPARSLLTAERAALNFLQLLSGTATTCRHYADLVANTGVHLLDTRKTIPGLRTAQKYAVTIGGCHNHRIGLYDAFLIKENHIAACGGIAAAVQQARMQSSGKPVEVEVENFDELDAALTAGCEVIMLDDFSLDDMVKAVKLTAKRAKLEASGGISDENLRAIADTGVDFISIGGLTKHCRAIDLSMRFF